MRRTCVLAAVAGLMILAPASAALANDALADQGDPAVQTTQESDEAAETPEETAYLEQMVCRAGPRPASRLQSRARICQTRRQWREEEDAAQRELRDMQRGGAIVRPPEGPR